jgi:hypothetical protein
MQRQEGGGAFPPRNKGSRSGKGKGERKKQMQRQGGSASRSSHEQGKRRREKQCQKADGGGKTPFLDVMNSKWWKPQRVTQASRKRVCVRKGKWGGKGVVLRKIKNIPGKQGRMGEKKRKE